MDGIPDMVCAAIVLLRKPSYNKRFVGFPYERGRRCQGIESVSRMKIRQGT